MSNTSGLILFLAAAVFHSAVHALAKPGGDFTAGNPAVAADVNAQFNTIYTALNSGTNSINIDGWTNTTGALGYTGGSLGVGIAAPTAKFHVVGGSAVTLAGATGFGVFGATTANHVAIDSTQIQAKATATTAANLAINPLGGNVGIGFSSPTMKLVVSGNTTSSIAAHSALDNTAYRGIGYHFIHETTDNAYILAQRASGVADGADLIFQTRPTGGALTSRMALRIAVSCHFQQLPRPATRQTSLPGLLRLRTQLRIFLSAKSARPLVVVGQFGCEFVPMAMRILSVRGETVISVMMQRRVAHRMNV